MNDKFAEKKILYKKFYDYVFSIKNYNDWKIFTIFGLTIKIKYNLYKKIVGKLLNLKYFIFLYIKVIQGIGKAKRFYLSKYSEPVKQQVRDEMSKIRTEEIDVPSDTVWTMWLQDDIPDMIKMCLDSIKLFYPNMIIITEKNVSEYVDIPHYILKKYQKGIIKPPHFSDYIRCYLLDKYGGIWIDASCLMCSKIPKYITKQKFFILQKPDKKGVSNFFLVSAKNNYFIKSIRIFLEQYWKNENFTIDYFFMHAYIALLFNKDDECAKIYKNIIPDVNHKIRYLVDNIAYNADDDCWDYLKKSSYMYKLNRKNKKAPKNKNSWYNYLLNKYESGDLLEELSSK